MLAAARLEPEWHGLLAVADEETRQFIETFHPDVPAAGRPHRPPGRSRRDPRSRLPRRRTARSGHRQRRRRPYRAAAPRPARRPAPRRRRRPRFRRRAGAVSLGMRTVGRDRLGRGRAARCADRPLDRPPRNGGEGVDRRSSAPSRCAPVPRRRCCPCPATACCRAAGRSAACPAFEPADGRFAGYRGIAPAGTCRRGAGATAAPLSADPDSLRELVHEIKTPLNAIIGFAEIIDGQFLGPADRHYRERAAEIVGQARMLLGRSTTSTSPPSFSRTLGPGRGNRSRRAARPRPDRCASSPPRAAPKLIFGSRAVASAAARSSRRWPSGWSAASARRVIDAARPASGCGSSVDQNAAVALRVAGRRSCAAHRAQLFDRASAEDSRHRFRAAAGARPGPDRRRRPGRPAPAGITPGASDCA